MIFNSLEEIKKYYNEQTNTYVFEEDGDLIELVELKFNLKFDCNIIAKDIKALDVEVLNINTWNIKANNINAWDIKAGNIDAKNIKAEDINANRIRALDIDARDINAGDIKANKINFFGVCVSYKNIICKSISGKRKNAKYLTLDGEVIIKEE